MCVNVQKPLDQGGAEGKAIYVDTEGTFRPQKLVAIAERFSMDSEAVLDNVICARAHNSEQQMELLADAAVSDISTFLFLVFIFIFNLSYNYHL